MVSCTRAERWLACAKRFALPSQPIQMATVWLQNYDPLHNSVLSTAVAALPVVVLLGSIAIFNIRIHLVALLGLAIALLIALAIYGMPVKAAAATAAYGA